MKIKHILTLFCVTLTLAFLLVSCADTSGGGGGGDTTEKQFSNVSAESCGDSTLELNCFISVWNTDHGPISEAITGVSDTKIVKLPLVEGGTYDFYVDWGDGEDVEKIEAFNALEVTHNYDESGTYTIHIAGTIKGWRFFTADNSYGDASKLTGVTQWGSLSLGNTAGGQFQGAENFNPTATDAPDVSETTSLVSAFAGAIDFNGAIGNWDVSQITDMKAMFQSASNFNQDISGWNVSKVTDMSFMFSEASSFNNNGKPLDWGDKTSNVTDMKGMFNGASDFNQDISEWDVGKVATSEDFAEGSPLKTNHTPPKFRGANAVSKEVCKVNPLINCFISVWNTTNSGTGASAGSTIVLPLVNNGEYNFYVDWGDGKEVEEITTASDATHTYDTAGEKTIHIAGTIKGWSFASTGNAHRDAAKLLNVTQWGSLSLGNTAGSQFQGAENFNPTATDAPDVSETTSLSSAFNRASNFNGEIGNWDVSKVTKMNNMFYLATSFNNNGKPLDWGAKTSKVTDMTEMFFAAGVFNQDISKWDVSEVLNMRNMFANATSFNQDISDWNVSKVTDMGHMFFLATSFNNNGVALNWGIKTSEVADMFRMFGDAKAFNQDISGWNVDKVTEYSSFATGSGLEFNNIPFKFRGLDTISKAICDANPLTNCFISVWNTANTGDGASDTKTIVLPLVSEGTYDFYVDWGDESDVQKIEAYDADKITHTYTTKGEYTIHIAGTIKGWRFYVEDDNYGDAAKLTDVSQWGSLSLGNTDGAQFRGAKNFNPTATDAPDVSETTSLNNAFASASNFNADISDWDVENVTSMKFMFANATSFNNNGKPFDWGIKTSKVTSMYGMFNHAYAFNQDISAWNVEKVTDMAYMFRSSTKFNNNGVALNWVNQTSKVTDMIYMFNDAKAFNQDISGWNVSEVTYMNSMFKGASSFNNNGKPLDWGIKTSKVEDMTEMFSGAKAFNQDICYWNVGNVTQSPPVGFANGSALANEHNPFHDDCTSTKSK